MPASHPREVLLKPIDFRLEHRDQSFAMFGDDFHYLHVCPGERTGSDIVGRSEERRLAVFSWAVHSAETYEFATRGTVSRSNAVAAQFAIAAPSKARDVARPPWNSRHGAA